MAVSASSASSAVVAGSVAAGGTSARAEGGASAGVGVGASNTLSRNSGASIEARVVNSLLSETSASAGVALKP